MRCGILFWAYFYIMGNLEIFKNNEFGDIRVAIINNEPWFVGRDIATSLGYKEPSNAVRRLVDKEDRMIFQLTDNQWGWIYTPSDNQPIKEIGIINESGLYTLVLSSKLESAKRFKRWVTSEVLPSIRKTGSYSIMPKDYASALRALADEVEAKNKVIAEKAQVEEERRQAVKTIELQQPDVEFAQSFKKPGENDMLIREVAKKLEQNNIIVAEKNLRLYLERTKFMFRNSRGEWELYSNVVRKGYGVYRSFYVDRHTGKIINGQTIYMTGSGYDVTIKAIKGTMRHIFEEYGKILD